MSDSTIDSDEEQLVEELKSFFAEKIAPGVREGVETQIGPMVAKFIIAANNAQAALATQWADKLAELEAIAGAVREHGEALGTAARTLTERESEAARKVFELSRHLDEKFADSQQALSAQIGQIPDPGPVLEAVQEKLGNIAQGQQTFAAQLEKIPNPVPALNDLKASIADILQKQEEFRTTLGKIPDPRLAIQDLTTGFADVVSSKFAEFKNGRDAQDTALREASAANIAALQTSIAQAPEKPDNTALITALKAGQEAQGLKIDGLVGQIGTVVTILNRMWQIIPAEAGEDGQRQETHEQSGEQREPASEHPEDATPSTAADASGNDKPKDDSASASDTPATTPTPPGTLRAVLQKIHPSKITIRWLAAVVLATLIAGATGFYSNRFISPPVNSTGPTPSNPACPPTPKGKPCPTNVVSTPSPANRSSPPVPPKPTSTAADGYEAGWQKLNAQDPTFCEDKTKCKFEDVWGALPQSNGRRKILQTVLAKIRAEPNLACTIADPGASDGQWGDKTFQALDKLNHCKNLGLDLANVDAKTAPADGKIEAYVKTLLVFYAKL